MTDTLDERRVVENELIFRQRNENLEKKIETFNRAIETDGQDSPYAIDGNALLYFYCECSDEQCKERIRMSLNDYRKIHQARDTFTIVCGHNLQQIEDVIGEESKYCIVRKRKTPRPLN